MSMDREKRNNYLKKSYTIKTFIMLNIINVDFYLFDIWFLGPFKYKKNYSVFLKIVFNFVSII